MQLSDFRIGNYAMNPYGTIIQIILEDLQSIYDESDESRHPKPIDLSTAWLKDFDWPEDRKRDKEKDIDGLWILNGITIYESAWDGDFNYATYVRGDGEFKGGFQIKRVHQLQNLFQALSTREIIRKAYYTK